MKAMDFVKGMGFGLVAGAAISIAVMPHKKMMGKKTIVGKALKAAGEIVENVTEAMGG